MGPAWGCHCQSCPLRGKPPSPSSVAWAAWQCPGGRATERALAGPLVEEPQAAAPGRGISHHTLLRLRHIRDTETRRSVFYGCVRPQLTEAARNGSPTNDSPPVAGRKKLVSGYTALCDADGRCCEAVSHAKRVIICGTVNPGPVRTDCAQSCDGSFSAFQEAILARRSSLVSRSSRRPPSSLRSRPRSSRGGGGPRLS